MVRRLLLLLFVLVVSSLALAAPVSAGGSGATSSTVNSHGVFVPFHVDSTCGTASGTISGTGNQVFHLTVSKDGNEFWLTTTQEAWFTITPDDPTQTAFSGHFAFWFGQSGNTNNFVSHQITNVKATATDGSGATVSFNFVQHFSVSASGNINEFMACH